MNGTTIANTPICVDCWNLPVNVKQHKVFFLSHMHADHTVGLSPSWRYPIYCSEVSGKLLKGKFNIKSQLIQTLAINESHIIPLNKETNDSMTVTLIDANHCPGAVIFIFEGYFGRIVYTGDFRYTKEMFVSSPLADVAATDADSFKYGLVEGYNNFNKRSKVVDILYLDNTYCYDKCVFPTREEATKQIIDIINRYPNHNIVLGLHSLGKEELLVDLAKRFNTWIIVNPQRYESVKLLGLPKVFSTNPKEGFIRVVPHHSISKARMLKWNKEARTVAIITSAIYTGLNFQPYINQDNVHILPYSDHSSYPELCEFVRHVCPRKIIPIVPANTRGPFGANFVDRANMSCFDKYLDPSPSMSFMVPEWYRVSESGSVSDADVADVVKHFKRRRQPLEMRRSSSLSNAKGVLFSDEESPKKPRIEKEVIQTLSGVVTIDDSDESASDGGSVEKIVENDGQEKEVAPPSKVVAMNSDDFASDGGSVEKIVEDISPEKEIARISPSEVVANDDSGDSVKNDSPEKENAQTCSVVVAIDDSGDYVSHGCNVTKPDDGDSSDYESCDEGVFVDETRIVDDMISPETTEVSVKPQVNEGATSNDNHASFSKSKESSEFTNKCTDEVLTPVDSKQSLFNNHETVLEINDVKTLCPAVKSCLEYENQAEHVFKIMEGSSPDSDEMVEVQILSSSDGSCVPIKSLQIPDSLLRLEEKISRCEDVPSCSSKIIAFKQHPLCKSRSFEIKVSPKCNQAANFFSEQSKVLSMSGRHQTGSVTPVSSQTGKSTKTNARCPSFSAGGSDKRGKPPEAPLNIIQRSKVDMNSLLQRMDGKPARVTKERSPEGSSSTSGVLARDARDIDLIYDILDKEAG